MQGRDLATLSALDEARMLKQLQEKDARDKKIEESKSMKFNKMKKENISVLQRQMMEKQQQKILKKLEDDTYASIIKQNVSEAEMAEKKKVEEFKKRRDEYNSKLQHQMHVGSEKKRYGILMSEHERRVNDRDINAYQGQEEKIYGNVPGFGALNDKVKQQQMIQQHMGKRSPAYSKKADVVIDHNYGKESMSPQ
jgi:hypothetical protein